MTELQSRAGATEVGEEQESRVNVPETDPAAEAVRHEQIMQLEPDQFGAVELMMDALADRSWRVRKAALGVLEERFKGDERMIPALVQGLASEVNAGLRNACAQGLVEFGNAALPTLLDALRSDDHDLRKFSVEVMGAIGTAEAREALLAVLDEADSNVRSSAVDALGRLGGETIVQALRERLRRPDIALQDVAYVLDALASSYAKLSYEEIEPLLEQRSLLRFAYPLLALCADPRAAAPLIAGVVAASRGTRNMATVALGNLVVRLDEHGDASEIIERLRNQPESLERLMCTLADTDDAAAEAALSLLGSFGDPSVAPTLVAACVARPYVQTGIEVVTAMGPSVVAPLLDALDRANVEARVLSLEIVESVGDATAAPRLLSLAKGMDPSTADAAVRALGKLGGEEAVLPLMDLVRREESGLSRQATFALGSIGRRLPDCVAQRARRAIEDGEVRPAWLMVLGAVARQDDIDVLIAAARHQDADVRAAAAEAAVSYGTRFPEDVLVQAFGDEHAPARAAAAAALAAYRSERAVDVLMRGLGDRDPWVVAEVVRALGAIGNPLAVTALRNAASNPTAPIAIAALQSLFRLHPAGMEAEVKKALQHGDPEVAREGINLTMRLSKEAATELLSSALSHQSWDVRWAAAELVATRGLAVAKELVQDCHERETEDVVREALSRLLAKLGSGR